MAKVQESVANVLTVCPSQPLVPFEGAKPLAAKDNKHQEQRDCYRARKQRGQLRGAEHAVAGHSYALIEQSDSSSC